MTASSQPIPRHSRRRVLGAMALAGAAVAVRRVPLLGAQTPAASGTTTFLDPSTIHDIAVTIDRDGYDAMIDTYRASGEKEWIEATISIDGAAYERAGLRLKGNSSLGGLHGGPRAAEPAGHGGDVTDAGASTDGPGRGGARRGADIATADTPERLPWLVRLDRFVDSQNHDGIAELVIRSNHSATSLNEAVALDLLALAGLASQRAAQTRYSVNDSEPALRLAIEHPDDAWMAARFSPGGLLYKAEAGGDWSYRGDDPDAYADAFDLEAGGDGDDAEDMQPLFDFLAFINDSDDDTFAAELGDHLDVDAFATYLAMMDLIENTDDISGPGNNAYLYVGPDATRFTVVPWDMNLAFGSLGGAVTVREGDPGPGGPEDLPPPPEGAEVEIVIGGTPAADHGFDSAGPGEEAIAAPHPNILVERWETVDAYTAMVDDARARLRRELYESGRADAVLARWVGVLERHAGDMLDAETIATEADAIAEYFD